MFYLKLYLYETFAGEDSNRATLVQKGWIGAGYLENSQSSCLNVSFLDTRCVGEYIGIVDDSYIPRNLHIKKPTYQETYIPDGQLGMDIREIHHENQGSST